MVCFPAWLQQLTPCTEAASEGKQLPQTATPSGIPYQATTTSHYRSPTLLWCCWRAPGHTGPGACGEQLTGWPHSAQHPRPGGSGDLPRSERLDEFSPEWDLCWTVISPRAGVCRYPLAQRSGCGEGKVPICCLHWLLTGHAVTSSHPSPDTSRFYTSIFLHIEPIHCHSQSLYLNKPFCWTRIKYSPVESDTMREPRLEARERTRRRSQLNKYI